MLKELGITVIPQACIVTMHERVNERFVESMESKQACERKTTVSVSGIANNEQRIRVGRSGS